MAKWHAFLDRLKRSQHYDPRVATRFEQVLRSESRVARASNALLWTAFHSLRVMRQLRHRPWRRLTAQPVASSSKVQPWQAPVTDNPVRNGVLIVAELSISQCRHYRVEQKVAMFRQLGQKARVVSWTEAEAAFNALQSVQLVIFYRTPATNEVKGLVSEAHRLGLPVIFDIDDLVFDVEAYSRNSNLRKLPPAEQRNLLDGARLYNEMLSLADHAIASTSVLAEHMRPFQSGSIHVVENGLDDALCQLANTAETLPDTGKIIIGYGSGTRTHDADFAEVADALCRVLERFSQVELAIFGHLTLPEAFSPYLSRIRRVPFIAAEDYYRALRQFDINLAPLEKGVFNDAKSNIKYLEASVFAIPSVASPRVAFDEVITHGENGFLADDETAWFEALSSLVESAPLRARIGQAARETVLEHYPLPTLAQHQLAPVLELAQPLAHGQAETQRHVMIVNVLFAPLSFGGATIVAEQLAKELGERPDTRVTVVTGCFTGDLAPGDIRQYTWQGLTVFAIGLIGGDKETEYDNPLATECFQTLLEATQPDIVHFHSIQTMGVGLAHACKAQHIPYLITLHDAWWLCERQFMVNEQGYCGQEAIDPLVCASCVKDPALTYHRRFMLQDVMRKAALLLSPSEFQRTLHARSGCPPEKLLVNKNGVLPPAQASQSRDDEQRPLVFAYLGGVADHKGYPWLKRLFESLDHDDYILRLVDIQARFGQATIRPEDWQVRGKVEVVPPFDTTDMDAFYADIDVLLFPSQWKESFGLTIREAMLRDVWIIATECGGPSEDLEPGVNGDVVAMDDTTGFREAILNCLRQPEKTRQYINPLSERVRTFSQQAEELSELMDRVLEETPRVITTQA